MYCLPQQHEYKNRQQYNNKSFTAHSHKLKMIVQCYIRVCATPKKFRTAAHNSTVQ